MQAQTTRRTSLSQVPPHLRQHVQQMQQRTPVSKPGLGEDYYDEVGDAADRDRFYSSVKDSFDSSDGGELYGRLHDLLESNHKSLGYGEARRHLYGSIDRRPDGGLYYLYSGEGPKNESEYTEPAKHELGNYNCEHVVPQSWFGKKSTPKADLHHLFTEQIQCNGSRGNYPLEDTPNGEKLPSCGLVDHHGSDRSFEPNAGKGEVARATLYFITRYPGEVGNSNRETQKEDLAQLLEWHREYPVSDYERHRNDKIEEVQGTRNPFIDFPELVEKVDFSLGMG